MTLKFNRVHPIIIGKICAQLDKNTLNRSISIVLSRLYSLLPILTLTSKFNRVYPLLLENICAEFDNQKSLTRLELYWSILLL